MNEELPIKSEVYLKWVDTVKLVNRESYPHEYGN